MVRYMVLIMLLLTLTIACNNKEEMNLKLDQNLNDPSHIGNLEIKKQKSEVLKKILQFDKFYRENLWQIRYVFIKKRWRVGWKSDFDDAYRIAYLRDSVLPKILDYKYLTHRLKEKAQQNSKLDDPGNAGYILTKSEYGKDIEKVSIQEDETIVFHNRCYLDNNQNDDLDAPHPREISKEEATFYLMSFIKTIDETHAVYKIHSSVTNGRGMAFLILELSKESGEWLIDDMYYIEKEDLIAVDNGFYKLIDYESNKEAYETGIKK